ncbi:hypothetical protein ILUMI_11508 [Ignelater luminosus]|uniref:Uncharacterized protein n=1 Tax=Ignelater luminosus TaxID=2038154 RepID=A0A8K0D000_IGNLU|nr:hypothetical protein ILUMI_11508 [Ignelater luminosus]
MATKQTNQKEAIFEHPSVRRKTAADHGVPQTTLEEYVEEMKQGGEVTIGVPLVCQSVFNKKEEEELAAYLKHLEERVFGLTALYLRRSAYQMAIKNNKKHNFSTKKKMRMKTELLDHAPPGTTAACNPQGWITTEIFTICLVNHTLNIEVIDLALRNGMIMLCFPPYYMHKLQPADVAFMRPLSTYNDHATTSWL